MKFTVISLLLIFLPETFGVIGKVGTVFEGNAGKEGGVKGIFLLENIIIPEKSAVYIFSTYVVETKPVWFQIWRPVNVKDKTYSLIGQVEFTANLVPKLYNVSIAPPPRAIFAEAGDKLAIYNEEDICPIAYKFIPGSPTFHYSVQNKSEIVPGFQAQFGTTSMPYQFAVEVYYDTDLQKYMGTQTPTQTTDQTAKHTIPSIPENTGTFEYEGNELSGKSSYMKENAQGMFLFPHLTLKYGVIIRFYAYFVKREEVALQVWRPYVIRNGAYVLVGEYRYKPDLVPQKMQIDLPRADYIFVQAGDLLGFTFPNGIGPIGYRFIENPAFVGPYRASIVQNKMPQLGEVVNFNMDKHPYDFAFGAFYDTDVDPSKYGTVPPSIPIFTPSPSSQSPTAPSSTPNPTTPLVINVPEDFALLGRDYLNVATRVLAMNAMRTFILPELKFPTSGEINSFYAYIVRSGIVHFQIWRRMGTIQSESFLLVSNKKVTIAAPASSNFQAELRQFQLTEGDNTRVVAGDCIGFANEQEYSVIGYQFLPTGAQLYTSQDGLKANTNETIMFSDMKFPYKFSLGAVFQETDDTVSTEGITEPVTKVVSATPEPVPNAEDFSWTLDSDFVFGMFIWLIIMSLLFLFLLLCVCILCCRKSNNQIENKRTSFLYDYESKNSVTRPPSAYLSSSQSRDNETMNYFNPKTGNKSGPVMRGDSMREKLIEGEDQITDANRNRRNYANNSNNNNIETISENDGIEDSRVTVVDITGDVSTHM